MSGFFNVHDNSLYQAPSAASMDVITEGLYLGNLQAANGSGWLVSLGITHVLSLTSEAVNIPAWTGIVHKQYRVRDNRRQNLLAQLLDGVQFIEDAFTGVLPTHAVGNPAEPETLTAPMERKVKVFVHCRMGISRSGAIVVAYIMKHHGKTFGNALEFVRKSRPRVRPNPAFVAQLMLLESTGFDLSHLGDELLNPNIENPYDPYDLEDRPRRRRSKENGASKAIEAPAAAVKEEVQYVPVAFASEADCETFKSCVLEVEPVVQAAEQRWKKIAELAKGLEAFVAAQVAIHKQKDKKLIDANSTTAAVRAWYQRDEYEAAKAKAKASRASSSSSAFHTYDTEMGDASSSRLEQSPWASLLPAAPRAPAPVPEASSPPAVHTDDTEMGDASSSRPEQSPWASLLPSAARAPAPVSETSSPSAAHTDDTEMGDASSSGAEQNP